MKFARPSQHGSLRFPFGIPINGRTALRYRRQLLTLKQQFAKFKSTVLLLDDKMDKQGLIDPHVLSLTHGVIDMEQLSPDYGTSRRRLRVSKLRAVKFREGYHDYIIATGSLRVFHV